jgi:hypothetical protein
MYQLTVNKKMKINVIFSILTPHTSSMEGKTIFSTFVRTSRHHYLDLYIFLSIIFSYPQRKRNIVDYQSDRKLKWSKLKWCLSTVKRLTHVDSDSATKNATHYRMKPEMTHVELWYIFDTNNKQRPQNHNLKKNHI